MVHFSYFEQLDNFPFAFSIFGPMILLEVLTLFSVLLIKSV